MVMLLIDHGADPAAKAHFGSTALDFARERGHKEVVSILTNAGSQPVKIEMRPGEGRPPEPEFGRPSVGRQSEFLRQSLDTGRPSGRESLAATAAEMASRRQNRRGVRASLVAAPISDAEAAARAALLDDDESASQVVNAIAKNIMKAESASLKKAEAAALPPTLYSEVLRVGPSLAAQESVDAGKLSVKDLRRRSIAAVIAFDVSRKEEYLTDEQFKEVFLMSKEEFQKLPKWKREMKKKELGLF
jgi:hypothetical protein